MEFWESNLPAKNSFSDGNKIPSLSLFTAQEWKHILMKNFGEKNFPQSLLTTTLTAFLKKTTTNLRKSQKA